MLAGLLGLVTFFILNFRPSFFAIASPWISAFNWSCLDRRCRDWWMRRGGLSSNGRSTMPEYARADQKALAKSMKTSRDR